MPGPRAEPAAGAGAGRGEQPLARACNRTTRSTPRCSSAGRSSSPTLAERVASPAADGRPRGLGHGQVERREGRAASLAPRASEPDAWQILPPIRPGKSPLASLAASRFPGEAADPTLAAPPGRIPDPTPRPWPAGSAPGPRASPAERRPAPAGRRPVRGADHALLGRRRARAVPATQLDRALAAYPDRLRVVLTLRSDFEPQFAHSPLQDEWLASRVVVPAMTLDEYREAIEGPASVKVLYFQGKATSQEFINRLIGDVANTPGALPLLSFTLSELYRRYLARGGDDRSLAEEDYEALGGVGGSLRNRADEVYRGLPDDAHRGDDAAGDAADDLGRRGRDRPPARARRGARLPRPGRERARGRGPPPADRGAPGRRGEGDRRPALRRARPRRAGPRLGQAPATGARRGAGEPPAPAAS